MSIDFSYEQLLQDKEDLETEFIDYKREIQHTTKGGAAKEVRILKGVVKNLEEELVEEKAKNQRAASKRNQECRKLRQEVSMALYVLFLYVVSIYFNVVYVFKVSLS